MQVWFTGITRIATLGQHVTGLYLLTQLYPYTPWLEVCKHRIEISIMPDNYIIALTRIIVGGLLR